MVMEKVYVFDLKVSTRVSNVRKEFRSFYHPLVVCDERRGDGTIIMAVTSPKSKKGCNVMRVNLTCPKVLIIFC